MLVQEQLGLERKWQKMQRLKTLMAISVLQEKSKKLRKEANNSSKETDRLSHVNICDI